MKHLDPALLLTSAAVWSVPLTVFGTVLWRRGQRHEIFPLLLSGCGTYLGFYASVSKQHWLVLVAAGLLAGAWSVRSARDRDLS